MEGSPEGTGGRRPRIRLGWLFMSLTMVVYLVFRLVQGVLWVSHHL